VRLDDVVAEGVKSVNIYPPGIRPDKLKKALPHRHCPGVRVGQTKDVMRIGIGPGQDGPDAGRQDLRFSRTGSGNDQYRSLDLVNCAELGLVQGFQRLLKS